MLRWANSPTAPSRVEGRNQGSFLLVFPWRLYASRCGYLAGGVAVESPVDPGQEIQ
jgi:hypothetical protein